MELIIYVQVSFSEKEDVKKRGGRWNAQKKLWYFKFHANDAGELDEDDCHVSGYPIKDVTFGSDELDAKYDCQVREIFNRFREKNMKYKIYLEKQKKKTL